MQARCISAKLNPCSGSLNAMIGNQAVRADTLQRNTPATADSISARDGPSRASNGRPSNTNIATSEPTDNDHTTLTCTADIPAARQRMTEKPSCSA